MTRVATAALVALVTAAASLSGCAERLGKPEYEEQLVKLSAERAKVLEELPAHGTGDVKFYADAQKRVQLLAEDLDAIEPPADVQQAHDVYVDSLYGLARVLGKLADCARQQQRDAAGADECRTSIEQADLDEVQNDFDEAEAIYRHEGYKLPRPAVDPANA